ncbi:MAG TPA: OmpA family protein [Bacteroidia bacterium]|nr:OmpA family protein [Bacteroidia bacterium]
MKANVLIFSAALVISTGIKADSICKRMSLFFDTDKSELSPVSARRLDSLVSIARKNESGYLLELYGHTDTVGNLTHNQTLSGSRMKSIEDYLDSKLQHTFTYRENEMPETNTKVSGSMDANLAYNRRVDIFLIPMNGNNVVVPGKPNESVEIPIDHFGSCGVCGSAPKVKSWYSADEAKGTNIQFQTNDSFKLMTAGTMLLDYQPCSSGGSGYGKDTSTLVFRVCGQKPDKGITLWEADTMNGKIYWKPSDNKFSYDTATGCYVFRAPAGQLFNLDKVYFDTLFRILLPASFAYNHAVLTRSSTVKVNDWKEDYDIAPNDTVCMLHALARDSGNIYLLAAKVSLLPGSKVRTTTKLTTTFAPGETMYRQLTWSDTLVKIKRGKYAQKATVGFYLPEYKEFLPADSVQGKYAFGKTPDCNYQYAYYTGKKLYVMSPKKAKVKTKKDVRDVRFNRRSKKKFHRVSDYKAKSR